MRRESQSAAGVNERPNPETNPIGRITAVGWHRENSAEKKLQLVSFTYRLSSPLTLTMGYSLGAKPLYVNLRDRCEGFPSRIVTDKIGHYRRAFNKCAFQLSFAG